MRFSGLALAFALVLPPVAHADSLDTFTITNGATTFTFQLPSAPSPTDVNGSNDFGILATYNGTNSGSGEFYFDISGNIAGPGFFDGTDNSLPTFTGSPSAPVFNLGAYSFNGGAASLVISGASVTPEPPSLLLLTTGLLGIFALAAPRRLAPAPAKLRP